MSIEAFSNINDAEKLKEKIISFAKDFDRKEQNYKSEIKILNEQIKSLRDKLFGRKTEKIYRDDGQIDQRIGIECAVVILFRCRCKCVRDSGNP